MESATPPRNYSKRKGAEPQDTRPDIPDIVDDNDHPEPKSKRPRLSIVAPSEPSGPTTRARAKRARERRQSKGGPSPSPSPSPPPQDIHTHQQQYLLEDSQPRSSATVRTNSLLSPLVEAPSPSVPSPASGSFVPPNILPTVTRETLRELDLEAILKNAQLRHDLLFDPGLQFRAVAGKRKLTAADRYWDAIASEFDTDCPCGNSICVCFADPATELTVVQIKSKRTRPPTPPPWSQRYTAYLKAATDPTLRESHVNARPDDEYDHSPAPVQGILTTASRVGPMLYELMAVLKCVIAPPPLPSSQPPRASHLQSVAEAESLLQHFDPILIEQELRRGIYEPAGLFKLIGETLKRHCAPMRDKIVDKMIDIAAGKEGGDGVKRTLSAARLCFEVLELMKLDIANHQLQHLRPFLASSTPEFLLRIFSDRFRHGLTSPANVQLFLQASYDKIIALPITSFIPPQPQSSHSPSPSPNPSLAIPLRKTQIHLAVIKALSELTFMPPTDSFPETLYLDTHRIALLIADAADLSALYMLIMLWRQLVYWKEGSEGVEWDTFPRLTRKSNKLENWEVDRIKKEIWNVSPKRVGSCFFVEGGESKLPDQYQRMNLMVHDSLSWRDAMENVAVQIASRAEDARTCIDLAKPASAPSIISRRPPSKAAVTLMNGWIATHLRRNSSVSTLFRNNLQREVFNAATRITFGGYLGKTVMELVPGPENLALGLESLMPEIRHLGQRIARLAMINMKVYGSLYEVTGFLKDLPVEAMAF